MRKEKILIPFFLLFIQLVNFYSQGVLSDLSSNCVVNQKWLHIQTQNSSFKTTSAIDTISINSKPFLDDFSTNSVYPDTAWWIDQYVYINRDFPTAPITFGVATFDGLDASGFPYDWSIQEPNTKKADELTSRYIDLGPPLSANDSIYLSFYYQAKGRGDAPESKDSLILEFKSPTKDWTKVWYKNGYTPVAPDTSFHLVMIRIAESDYLQKGFQFRFKNYATLSGNADHWHLDYVYLNKTRNINDTLREDIAFVYNPPSFLTVYQAMPWEQYSSSEMNTEIKMFIRNNMNVPKNTNYNYFVKNTGGTELCRYFPNGTSGNVNAFIAGGYDNQTSHASPTIANLCAFPTLTDTSTFFIEHRLEATPDEDTLNDKIIFQQKFHNYYAYDDGTAEKAYSVHTDNIYSYVANKFDLKYGDSLKAIDAFFDPVYENVSQNGTKPFPIKIIVWGDNGGVPGDIIHEEDTVVYPAYEPGYNGFHTFKIGTSGIELNSGTFYIGWQQVNSFGSNPPKIRIGFDVNTNSNSNTFYDLTGTGTSWSVSNPVGSLMIRPIMKKIYYSSKIDEITSVKSDESIEVSPNPANEYVQLSTPKYFPKNSTITIYDMFGRIIEKMESEQFPKMINTSLFANGVYLIEVANKLRKNIEVKKLMVAH